MAGRINKLRPAPIGENEHQKRVRLAERKLLGQMSKRELARKTGLHHTYVARLIKGTRAIETLSLVQAMVLSKGVGMDLPRFTAAIKATQRAWADLEKYERGQAKRQKKG
jgi:transcriptional regulator with XRE-family HTH domain